MKLQKITALLLAAMMVTLLLSCEPATPDATVATEQTETTAATETATGATEDTTAETTTEQTTAEETTGSVIPPEADPADTDHKSVSVGDYVTLFYNGATCTVDTSVAKGLGSKQNVTITVTVRDGFLYDGISLGNAIVNGSKAETTDTTYTLTVSEATKVYVNTSMTLRYHANGGKVTADGGDLYTSTFSLVFYHNPKTLPEKDYFTRDGYLLTSYSTEADGTGKVAYLGNGIDAEGAPVMDLYCVWEKETDASAFTVSGTSITGYTGSDETVVIPAKIDGKTVKSISGGAFKGASLKRVVIGPTVEVVSSGAFQNCKALETVVLFDRKISVSEDSFSACGNLKQLRVCATYTQYNFWARYGATKLDRLMWAKNQKKIVIFGGSGSYYGYDSAVLDEALNGEYTIINYGENANITSQIYFDIAEDFVGEDDILLWSPEPGSNTLGSAAVGYRFWAFMQPDYGFLEYVDDISLYSGLISGFSGLTSELSTGSFLPSDAATASTTLYGDNDSPNTSEGNKYTYDNEFDTPRRAVGPNIAYFVSRVQEKGASVYFSYAAMQASGMKNVTAEKMAGYEKIFTDIGIVSISDYTDCMYDDDLFWNSAWHMTREGQTIRSEHVAADIIAQLQKEGKLAQ